MDKPKLTLNIDISRSRPWSGIVWHHSATADGISRDWYAIRKYHTSFRIDGDIVTEDEYKRRLAAGKGSSFQTPWSDIAYHGGTERVNGQLVFNWGRSLLLAGAHSGVKGASNIYNTDYLGLCAVGDFDKATPAPDHWDFNLQLTRALMEAFRIPASHVIGHREVFDRLGVPRQKTCPGKCWDLDLFRSEL
ncbi:MAG: hypothetical protein A2218_10400 [Elusimicrobia bacterium RIFOXYA2_FULL_53_38]|nr:MAG: hypothetical protein A2218_10400 [Elusimicrobia bacterium RIFOXYA2_FULL_53_38]